MLLARLFSYADAHRARLGVNYKQIPVNQPKVPVHSYSKDGAMRVRERLRPRVRARTPRAARRPTPNASRTWRSGKPTASSSTPPTRSARTTTTGASPAPWCARSWTTSQRDRLVVQRRRSPQQRRVRARAGACVRVLAQYRQGDRRPHRQGLQRRLTVTSQRRAHIPFRGCSGLRCPSLDGE